jgi:transposase
LLLASLLQAFYEILSQRLLLKKLHNTLVFRWFVGLSPDDPSGTLQPIASGRLRLHQKP